MGNDITKLKTGNVSSPSPVSIHPPAKTETVAIPPPLVKPPSIAAVLLSRIWKISESEETYYSNLMEFLAKVNEACADDFPPEDKDKTGSFTLEGYKAIVDNLFSYIIKNIDAYSLFIIAKKYDNACQLELKLKCLLEFARKIVPSLRNENYPNKIEKVAEVITKIAEVDNWILLEKSLSLLNRIIDYIELSDKTQESKQDYGLCLSDLGKNRDFLRWLRCIGNGYNINSEKKMSFVEVLRESQLIGVKELLFQYIVSEKQESNEEVDKKVMKTIRVNAESIGDDNGKPSFVIVKNLVSRCQLEKTMIEALTCKFRLFLTVKSEEEKFMVVLCSLYAIRALLAFKKVKEETQLFITEMEPKVRLVPELIQLVRGAPIIRPEIYKTAIDIISLLVLEDKSANLEAGFVEDIMSQLGLKVPHIGFLLLLLRDMTSLEIVRASNRQEILPKAIIASEDMLVSCLKLLKVLYFCTDDGDDRRQQGLPELIRFWRAVANLLVNIIRVREDAKKYIFSLRATYLSVDLIKLIIKRYKTILDQALVTCTLKRLEFELDKLERDDDYMGYENKNQLIGMSGVGEIPELVKIKDRQKLCKVLMSCISNFMGQSSRRDVQGLDINPEIGSGLNRGLPSALRRNERDIMEDLRSQRRSGSRRNIMNALIEGEEEVKDEEADERAEERVNASRQVLNSKQLFEKLANLFKRLPTESKIYYNFSPISYSSLMLIGNLVNDTPASIPTLISGKLIIEIFNCLKHKIILADDYFYSVLSFLSALSLHEEGVNQIKKYYIITKLLNTFLQDEYLQCKQGKYEDCGQLISKLSSHSPDLSKEIVNVIHIVVARVLGMLEEQLKKLADSRKNEKMPEFEKGIIEIKAIEGETAKNIAKYNMLILNGISGFLLGIYSNHDSRDQMRLIEALGKNDPNYTANLLNLSKLGKMFSIYVSGDDKIHDSFFKILKCHIHQPDFSGAYYGSSTGRNELKDVQRELNLGIGMLKQFFTESIMKEGIVNYLRKVPTFSVASLQNFPMFDQVLQMLIHAQWISEVIKHFAKHLQTDYGDHLKFITKIYKFIMSELMNAIADNKNQEKYKASMSHFIHYSNNESRESIFDGDFSRNYFKEFLHSVLPNSLFYSEIYETYLSIIKLLVDFNKSSLRKRRHHSYSGEENTKAAKIIRSSGLCAVELAKEAFEVPYKEGGSSGLLEQSIFHKMVILEDVKCILNGIGIIIPLQLYEFYKSDGFEYLHSLYRFVVNNLLKDPFLKIKSPPILWKQFQYLSKQIFKIYSIATLPANLRLFSSHSPAVETLLQFQKELTDAGYKTPEDLAASILVNTVDSILFHTKYDPYKSSLRFLAENAQPAFDLFLNILRKYAIKDVANGIFGSGGGSRYRAGNNAYLSRGEVPGYMISEMENMGFEAGEAEEAIRRSNLNLEQAMEDLLAQRTNRIVTAIAPAQQVMMASTPAIAKRKIEAKNLSKEIQIWIDHILISLYEALYIASQYRCKFLIHSLIECQENLRNYKTRHGFIFLLNELQTLLFSIELNYQFSPIPNDEFPQIELCDPQLTEKQLKKRHIIMYVSGIKEEEYMILFKMKCLINLILTFLRLAKRNDLLKLMYENKFSLCLIEILKKITQTEYSVSARKSVTKILIMLGMIINESNSSAALLPPEKLLPGNGLTEIEMSSLLTIVSSWIDMDNEFVAKGSLAATTEAVPMTDVIVKNEEEDSSDNSDKESNKGSSKPQKLTFITPEIVTAILVLLIQLSTNPKNTPLIIKSGIIHKLLQYRQVSGNKINLPIPLLIKLIHNIIESDQIIHEYNFEKIIISLLLGKTHYYSSKKKREKTGNALVEELQKETEEDLDKFTQIMGFLIKRNSNLFYKACDYNCELFSTTTMDNSKKPPAKTVKVLIRLKAEVIARILNEEEMIYKQASMMNSNNRINWAVEKCCSIINSSSPQANLIISLLLDRIIELNEFTKAPSASMTSTEITPILKIEGLIEVLTDILRNYPEMIALLLTFNNGRDKAFVSAIATKAKVTGNNLISYLLKSVFPQQHILLANGTSVKADKIVFNDSFRRKAVQFIKVLTSGNPYLLLYHHNILAIGEIKKRVSIEILNHLQNIIKKFGQEREVAKPGTTLSLSCFSAIYSHLTILDSILNNTENSILTPKLNQYQFFQEILISNSAFNIVENLSTILKQIDLHSEHAQSIILPIISIFERILRFRSAPKKKQEEKGSTILPIATVLAEKEQKAEPEKASLGLANESYFDERTEK